MEKLRRENDALKTELAMEFRQFRKPVDTGSSDRVVQVVCFRYYTLTCAHLGYAYPTVLV